MPVSPLLYRLAMAPEDLPPVDPSHLVRAWNAATLAAETGLLLEPGDIEGVEFRWDGGESRFMFADLDASCWAAALDRLYGLESSRGISILFRLLALIDLLARADWLRPLFRLGHADGIILDLEVMALLAAQPLTASARFDVNAIRKALGHRVTQPANKRLAGKPRLLPSGRQA